MRGSRFPLAFLVLLGTLELSSAQQAGEGASALVNPNPLSSLNLDSLSATRSLPLFTPSRTAPAPEAPPEDVVAAPVEAPPSNSEQPPPTLELIGIVITDSTQTALLRDPTNNEVHRLTTGDDFGGWAVKIVDARSVELRSGDRVQALKMFQTFDTPAGGEPQGEPFDESMPPPDVIPWPQPGEPPPPDSQGQDSQGTSSDPDVPSDPAPAADFAPKLGGAPIPEEGALRADPNGNL